MNRWGTAMETIIFENWIKMSGELDFTLSKAQKVALYVQAFLKHWGLRERLESGGNN